MKKTLTVRHKTLTVKKKPHTPPAGAPRRKGARYV